MNIFAIFKRRPIPVSYQHMAAQQLDTIGKVICWGADDEPARFLERWELDYLGE